MRRDPVTLIWLAGIALAVLLYLVDPAQVLDSLGIIGREIARAFDAVFTHLSLVAFGAVRALALASFAVFCALSLVSIRRGGRGRTALLAVTGVFLLLVAAGDPPSDRRWGLALILSAVASLAVTRRLRGGLPTVR